MMRGGVEWISEREVEGDEGEGEEAQEEVESTGIASKWRVVGVKEGVRVESGEEKRTRDSGKPRRKRKRSKVSTVPEMLLGRVERKGMVVSRRGEKPREERKRRKRKMEEIVRMWVWGVER